MEERNKMGGGTGTGPIIVKYKGRNTDVFSLRESRQYDIVPTFDRRETVALCGDGAKIYEILMRLSAQEENWRNDVLNRKVYVKHHNKNQRRTL